MKLLLDTHAVLWWQGDSRQLKSAARKAIATADLVWVSSVTASEVAIKISQGRLRVNEPVRITVGADDFTELPLTIRHTEELQRLAFHHTDPFDRMLIAQARVEGATIVTHDCAFEPYGVPVIWT